MRLYLGLLLTLALAFTMPAFAAGKPVRNAPFVKTVYFASPSGALDNANGSGASYGSAKNFTDQDILTLQPGMEIQRVYYIVDSAISGTSAVTVGDDDAADGFATSSATLGTPGIYGDTSLFSGSYLQAGANKLPKSKYYGASGKEVKVDFTGASTGGRLRVVIEGFNHAYP